MSPIHHTRTYSMPARTPVELVFKSPTPAELIFCSDAEYHARTLSSPARATMPTRLVKSRPFAHVRDSIALRRERRARAPLDFASNHTTYGSSALVFSSRALTLT